MNITFVSVSIASLVVLAVPAVVVAEDAIKTATEVTAADKIDIHKATIKEIKAWLKRDERGYMLMTQFRKLNTRPMTRSELIELFGEPTSSLDKTHLSWYPSDEKKGIVLIEDATRPGVTTGKLYALEANEPTVYFSEEDRKGGFLAIDVLVLDDK